MSGRLEIQKLLDLHGLDHVVDSLKLIAKRKGDLVLLKYNQIESDYSIEAVQESRGIILDASDNWNIVCYGFKKFFNSQEGFAHSIDWNTARIYDKLDGSLINIWNHKGEWRLSTSGTIDGETDSNGSVKTFKDLVFDTISLHYKMSFDEFASKFDPMYTYMFELCTPYNLVVTQHKDSKLHLLGLRHKGTLIEEAIEQSKFDWLSKPKSYSFKNLDEIRATFKDRSWEDEGNVVCDANFNRIKEKNPSYVACHHLKSNLAQWHVMEVIKKNEVEEFCVYFKEREDEVRLLAKRFKELEKRLGLIYADLAYCSNTQKWTQKDFAEVVFKNVERVFTGLMFGLRNGKMTSVRDYLCELDDKFLYLYLLNEQNFNN